MRLGVQGSGFSRALLWDFPGGSVVKTQPSNAGDARSIPNLVANIPHA